MYAATFEFRYAGPEYGIAEITQAIISILISHILLKHTSPIDFPQNVRYNVHKERNNDMIVTSATKARANFFTLINDVDEPVIITGKRGNKIMISEEDWRALEETNYLASIPGMVESIQKAEKSGDFVIGEAREWSKELYEIIKLDPFQKYPPYEALKGELKGFYSRRINIKHRLVYSVDKKSRTVRILRMWTHYEK